MLVIKINVTTSYNPLACDTPPFFLFNGAVIKEAQDIYKQVDVGEHEKYKIKMTN